jgi:predicted HTH transcriptional regulator
LINNKNDVVVSYSEWDFDSRSEKKQIESDLKGAHYLARSSDFRVLEDDESEYKTIIQNGETEEVEFKGSFPNHAEKVVHDIFAIANTNGGKLFMGVTDNQEVRGTDIQRSRERISDLVGGNTSYPVSLNQEAIEIDGNDVLVVEIPEATETPYSLDGRYYCRNGPQNERMDSLQMAEWFEEKLDCQLNPSSR